MRRRRTRRWAWTGTVATLLLLLAFAVSLVRDISWTLLQSNGSYWRAALARGMVRGGWVDVRNAWNAPDFFTLENGFHVLPALRDVLQDPVAAADWWPQWALRKYEIGIGVPLWIPLVVVGLLTRWAWRKALRSSPRACGECGYDLTGNVSGRCPECGAEVVGKPAEPPGGA